MTTIVIAATALVAVVGTFGLVGLICVKTLADAQARMDDEVHDDWRSYDEDL